MLYVDVDEALAATLAERLRAAVEARTSAPRVTASFDVAAWSSEHASPEALKAAAAALYRAKQAGGNRVVRSTSR